MLDGRPGAPADAVSAMPQLQEAVREVRGVARAMVRWPDPLGPAELQVEFSGDADRETVARDVLAALRHVGGVDLATLSLTTIEETDAAPVGRRPVFSSLSVDRGDLDATVEVTLSFEGRPVVGRAAGLSTALGTLRTAAAATLAALEELIGSDARVQLDWLEVVEVGAPGRPEVVSAAITFLTRGSEEIHVGSALVRGDEREAAVRATLDALNRRLEQRVGASSGPQAGAPTELGSTSSRSPL